MRAKTAAKLCAASVIAGAVLTPPVTRFTKRQAEKALRRGARGYIEARERVRSAAEATGRPGQLAAIAAALAFHSAKDAMDRWRELVADVEAEVEKDERIEQVPSPEPMMTIDEYMAAPG